MSVFYMPISSTNLFKNFNTSRLMLEATADSPHKRKQKLATTYPGLRVRLRCFWSATKSPNPMVVSVMKQ